MKLPKVKHGSAAHLKCLARKIPYIDIDVVRLGLESCEDCKERPRWTAHGPSVGYELACRCRATTHWNSRNQAIKVWRKNKGWKISH